MSWSALLAGARASLRLERSRDQCWVEAVLSARFGAADVLLTDSGTSALRLAMAGAGDGRPVAIPAYSCYDVVTAAVGADVPVVFYDVDPATLGPDPESLARASAADPGAVVVCHLFGHLVDVGAVQRMIGDALLVEDAAQGVGGTLNGRPLGSFGSVSVLSFGRGKGTTGGGGGALLAHDARGRGLVERSRNALHKPGRGGGSMVALTAQLALGRPSLYGLPASLPFLHLGETRYRPPWIPEGMTNASKAVLRHTLDLAEAERPIRLRHAARLERALSRSTCAASPRSVVGGAPGYLRLPALLRSAPEAAKVHSAGKLGVARGYPRPLPELSSARDLMVHAQPMPGARDLAERLITLPTHSLLTEEDLVALESWLAASESRFTPGGRDES